jgi:hypothetical protein
VLATLFLVTALLNGYWAAKIYSLSKREDDPEQKRNFLQRARRLTWLSRGSCLLVFVTYLITIIIGVAP